jgi:glutamate racemase
MAKEDRYGRVQEYSCHLPLSSVKGDMRSHAIGIFDSGIGGLSVLRALRAEMPLEQYVYVADSGYAPYGERDDGHVLSRAHAITQYLLKQHSIKALVVACNTATAAAIRELRHAYPQLPIVGIEPALKPAAAISKTGRVGVMATRGTLNSEKFKLLLQTLQGAATFVLQACDGLAYAIEQGDAINIEASLARYTGAMGAFGSNFGEIDTLVLGCTHYPFIADQLRQLVGTEVAFLEGGVPVARQTKRLVSEQAALIVDDTAQPETVIPQPIFFSTGVVDELQSAVLRWMGLNSEVRSVKIAMTG